MNNNVKNFIGGIIILTVGILVGLAIPTVVKKSQDFDRFVKAREAAEDKEQFDKNFDAMVKWFEEYRENNPEATDEDAQRAFDELWKGK